MGDSPRGQSARRIPLGPLVGAVVSLVYLVAWIVAAPATGFTQAYLGDILGVQAVVYLAWSMIMVTVLPGMERLYGGIDHQVKWHRYAAITGFGLFIVHGAVDTAGPNATDLGKALGSISAYGLILLILWALLSPTSRAAGWRGPIGWVARQPYDRWKFIHRFIGLFLVVAMIHGLLDGTSLAMPALWWMYLIICATGALAYLYREFVMLRVLPRNEYDVAEVRRPDKRTLIVTMTPVKQPLPMTAGQYAYVHFGTDNWDPHPFTIASPPGAKQLEFAIRNAGDDTQRLYDSLAPGTRAIVGQAHGYFNFAQGGKRQVWIAGGIGITPFLSWLRSLDDQFSTRVDLHVAAKTEAEDIYASELRELAATFPTVRLHAHYSDSGDHVKPQFIATELGAELEEVTIYMCGPRSMMRALEKEFAAVGVPHHRIHWEDFSFR